MEKKTYTVLYWEHTSMDIEVEATSPEEAEEKARQMAENGEIDFSLLSLGDSGFEVVD